MTPLSTAQSHTSDDDDEGFVQLGHAFRYGLGDRPFGISRRDRAQHLYLVGKSGTGKSTALKNIVLQDIHLGAGLALLDPHGDLCTEALDAIPSNRFDDVIYLNPADIDFPLAFNVLSCNRGDVVARALRVSAIVTAFKAIWSESWGPRLQHILSNAIATLIECSNTSLLGLPRMLEDADYRRWVVQQVTDPVVRDFWEREFAGYDPRFRREAIAPIQNKIGQLFLSPHLRLVLGQVKNKLDLRWAMDHGKIIIANLSKGAIGEDKSALLGALLVGEFQQAALSRANVPPEQRPPFYLTIDEFQSFSTDAVLSILSESRKFALSLTLAHQYLDQLPPGVAAGIFGNCGTMISFRVGEKDAQVVSREFGGGYAPESYAGQDNGQVVVKLLESGRYGNLLHGRMLPPLPIHYGRSDALIRLSRQKYATPRVVVEDQIRRWRENNSRGHR